MVSISWGIILSTMSVMPYHGNKRYFSILFYLLMKHHCGRAIIGMIGIKREAIPYLDYGPLGLAFGFPLRILISLDSFIENIIIHQQKSRMSSKCTIHEELLCCWSKIMIISHGFNKISIVLHFFYKNIKTSF
jgi:hypothetical protein